MQLSIFKPLLSMFLVEIRRRVSDLLEAGPSFQPCVLVLGGVIMVIVCANHTMDRTLLYHFLSRASGSRIRKITPTRTSHLAYGAWRSLPIPFLRVKNYPQRSFHNRQAGLQRHETFSAGSWGMVTAVVATRCVELRCVDGMVCCFCVVFCVSSSSRRQKRQFPSVASVLFSLEL